MQACRLAKISVLPVHVRPLYWCVPRRRLSSLSFISRLFGISTSEPKPHRVPNNQTFHGVELQDDFSWLKYRGSKVGEKTLILSSSISLVCFPPPPFPPYPVSSSWDYLSRRFHSFLWSDKLFSHWRKPQSNSFLRYMSKNIKEVTINWHDTLPISSHRNKS